jgi:hypothetical protein
MDHELRNMVHCPAYMDKPGNLLHCPAHVGNLETCCIPNPPAFVPAAYLGSKKRSLAPDTPTQCILIPRDCQMPFYLANKV